MLVWDREITQEKQWPKSTLLKFRPQAQETLFGGCGRCGQTADLGRTGVEDEEIRHSES